MYPLLHKLF